MKKLVLIVALIFMSAIGYLNAQVIENFESITMNIFDAGANGAISVVANPDQNGNASLYVGKMIRGFDGQPWAGWYSTLGSPIDITANPYVHVKVWKPRISPVVFKVEGGAGNSGDVYSTNPQTLTNQWEELVFDLSTSAASGEYVKIVLIPDFESPLTLTEDIVIYYDDLYVNNDPAVGSAAVQVMENFETIPLNYMLGGAEDLSFMELIPNPDISGVNLSQNVIHYLRDKDGVPWGGFWSDAPVDFTDNKYVHIKVWKPRISPIKFKVENPGVADPIEVASMNEQTVTDGWQDMVFDFSSTTGVWPRIAFFPDFEDPLTLTEDIDIYFDDIIVNNDPNPIQPPAQTISVDMTESGMTAGEPVWIAGALGGIYGTWNEPGTNPNNEMTDTDGDGIYSITLSLPEGVVAFKFFWANGWANGDPAGDRNLVLVNTMDVMYKWDFVPTLPAIQWIVNMSLQIDSGNFIEGTDYLDIAGTFNEWAGGEDYHLTTTGDSLYEFTMGGFEVGEMIEYKFRINGDWATSEFPNGGPNRTHTLVAGVNLIEVWYNDEVAGIHDQVMQKFNIYPNPVYDNLYIGNMKNVNRVEIFNVTGKLVKSFDYNTTVNQTQINLSDLNSGMYFITIYTGNSSGSAKILKF